MGRKMEKKENANMAYIDNNNYHINIKTNVNGKNFSNVDIYKKDYIIKTFLKLGKMLQMVLFMVQLHNLMLESN